MLVSYWRLWDTDHGPGMTAWAAYVAAQHRAFTEMIDMQLSGHIARDAESGAVLTRIERAYELLVPIPNLPPGTGERWLPRSVGNRRMAEAQAVDAANAVLASTIKRASKAALAYLPEARRAAA